jgi:ornithine cyclodeaminase/alanine dehydrogenase-like protein (mu-crystallin family)
MDDSLLYLSEADVASAEIPLVACRTAQAASKSVLTLGAARTAAMTAIAAQKLARAESRSIGFLGCGVQARSHFDALRLVLPGLKDHHAARGRR